MRGLTVVSAPAQLPLDLEGAKAHLRVDHNDENALITGLIGAAQGYYQKHTGRVLVTTTFRLSLDYFPCGGDDFNSIELPRSPVTEIVAVNYVDAAGDTQSLAAADYQADLASLPARLAPAYGATWPTPRYQPGSVQIDFKAGHGAQSADVPEDAKLVLRLLVGHWYLNREAVGQPLSELPLGIQALLALHWDGAYAAAE